MISMSTSALYLLPALATALTADPDINDIVQTGFKDASFSGKIEYMKQSELVKIKKDFANNYRIKNTKFWLKEPHMIRIQAKVEDTDVLYVVNGKARLARIPRAGVNQKDVFERAPGKRQTLLDFGLVTPSMFKDPFAGKYVRTDRQSGDYVFDLTFKRPEYDDNTRHRVWVDPKTKITVKREWYNQDGRLLATFLYEEPVNQNGGWMATKVSVKNVEGKLAGVTRYENPKINTGLEADLFAIK